MILLNSLFQFIICQFKTCSLSLCNYYSSSIFASSIKSSAHCYITCYIILLPTFSLRVKNEAPYSLTPWSRSPHQCDLSRIFLIFLIFTSFCSKNSSLPHPVLKSLVNKYSVCVLWPYFVLNKVLSAIKVMKKTQMSGHVKTSPGPQNTLRPQRENRISE